MASADTPFINSLPKDKREYVARKAINPRPAYYSAGLASLQQSESIRPNEERIVGEPEVQISADFEALLILTPAENRADLIYVLRTLTTQAESDAEAELMKEIVAIRIDTYVQLTTDYAELSSKYDSTKQRIIELMVELSNETADPAQPNRAGLEEEDPSIILIPDVGNLFNVTSSYLNDFVKPEAMGVHDRIVDEMMLYSYTNAGLYRLRELSSWIEILNLYQTKV